MKSLNWTPEALNRSVEGITSLLLSLKFRPFIRYRANSTMAQSLAKHIQEKINKESTLFDFPMQDTGAPPPLLLIMDRRDDPVTPLLNQWTYQAMVHELLAINNNRINLSGIQGVPKDLQEVVMAADQDEFYSNVISMLNVILTHLISFCCILEHVC